MAKVFVAQRQPHLDMTAAEEFGKVEYIMPTGTQIWTEQDAPEFVDIARRKLKDVSADDMLVLTGDPVMCALIFSIMVDRCEGIVNVLKWDRRKGKHGGYSKIAIDVDSQPTY